MNRPLVIGTRASKLAVTQAQMLRDALLVLNPGLTVAFAKMTTAGDREVQKDISQWGFKGLFTRELEDGLLDGSIDLAVHSTKDMPSLLPEGLIIAAVLERADVRDAWVSRKFPDFSRLPRGAVVGTSSTRRAAQLLHRRPDLTIVPLRGNVDTRLQKIADGVADGTFLAAAGLKRLGYEEHISEMIPAEIMLPAAAQGAICIECRADREDVRGLLDRINHRPTELAIRAERAFLLALDGSCRTPIAALAGLHGGQLHLRGEVLALDGSIRHGAELSGNEDDAETIGRLLGEELRRTAGEEMLRQAGL